MWINTQIIHRPANVWIVKDEDVDFEIEVRRSSRRKRTVSAFREGDVTVVAIPARFTRAQEREWVEKMLERLKNQEKRRRPTDAQLHERALKLSEKYLGSQAHPKSVTWSSSQNRRWGSCTPATGSIRISDRLKGMPHWVLDYVLLHELAHMITPDHSSQFWALLAGYERTERARGFLEGVSFEQDGAAGPEVEPDDIDAQDEDDIDTHDAGDSDTHDAGDSDTRDAGDGDTRDKAETAAEQIAAAEEITDREGA